MSHAKPKVTPLQIKAHFDGKVLIPAEPLPIPPGSEVRITIETVSTPELQKDKPPAKQQSVKEYDHHLYRYGKLG